MHSFREQGNLRPKRHSSPGSSVLDNLRYLALMVEKAKRDECRALVQLVHKKLDIEDASEARESCDWLVRELLQKVATRAREKAISARGLSISEGAVIAASGEKDYHPFLVAAASELLGCSDELVFCRVRRVFNVSEEEWKRLCGKEGHGKRLRQLRAGLWLGERTEKDYSSRRARDRENELLEEFEKAINDYLCREESRRELRDDYQTYQDQLASKPPLIHAPEPCTDSADIGSEPTNRYQADALEQRDEPSGYIHRPGLESQFKSLEESGARLIALVGLPGMGKSSLARALAPDAPFIEFQNGKPALVELQLALVRYGLRCDDLTDANAVMKLVHLLITESGPKFVVLDNLQSTSELRDLVPRTTTRIVVATCRESGDRAPAHCKEVVVGTMRPDEALRLLKLRLPLLIEADAKISANVLGCYPLIIDVACKYVTAAGVSMRELCSSLRVGPGDVKTEGGETLRVILKRTVTLLRERNPVAVELLACFVSDKRLFPPSPESLLALVCELYGFDVGISKYAAAINDLKRYFLCEITFDRIDQTSSPPRLNVHPLVKTILLDLLQDDIRRVDDMVDKCLVRLIAICDHARKQGLSLDLALNERVANMAEFNLELEDGCPVLDEIGHQIMEIMIRSGIEII